MKRLLLVLTVCALMLLSYGVGTLQQAQRDDRALDTLDSLNALAPTVNPKLPMTVPDSRRRL